MAKRRRKKPAPSGRSRVSEPPKELFNVETPEQQILREAELDEQETLEEREKAHKARLALCREDVNAFAEYVGRDDETNEKIKQAEIHEDFQLLADYFPRLITMAHPESGKTVQLAILRSLFKLGNNPNLRIAVVSKNEKNAMKSTRAMKEYIEKSEDLAEVFPELLPGGKWEEDFFQVRRSSFSKDPSVAAYGLFGSPTGSRIDILILDDAIDQENTLTASQRKKVISRIRGTWLDRLSPNAVVIMLTNAWHPEDAAHIFEKETQDAKETYGDDFKEHARKYFHVAKFPVIDPATGDPTWPERFPLERIEEKKIELGALEFARAFLCIARDEGESPFDIEAIDNAIDRARDEQLQLVYVMDDFELPPGAAILTGVDLAVTKKDSSHLTALETVLYWPIDMTFQLLWSESGRWSSREIRDRVIDHHKRYNSLFIIENNAAQRWIFDIISNQYDLPPEERVNPRMVPYTTGKRKADPTFGVEGLAAELARDKWLFPTRGPAGAVKDAIQLYGEMKYYSRGAHTGDRLMALWFAREGVRRLEIKDRDRPPQDEETPDLPPPDSEPPTDGGVTIIGV